MGRRSFMLLRSMSWKRPVAGQGVSRGAWERRLITRDFDLLLRSIPYVGIHVRARVDGPWGQRAGDKPTVLFKRPDMKKKVSVAGGSAERHLAAVETSIFANLMPLVEHCALVKYDDGDPRKTGWVRWGTQGAAWTLDVKDPDSEMSFRLVDSSLDKLWENAALLLACDEAPFSEDPYLKRKGPAKKK